MTRRAIRQERRSQEEAKWIGFSDHWTDERDEDLDEYPEPEEEETQRSLLQ